MSLKTVPKAVDFSESSVQTVADTPRLAAPSDKSTTVVHSEVLPKEDDTMQLDSPVVPPLPSPDKDYEGPPTPG